MDNQLLSLYANGMPTREIALVFKELYDADVGFAPIFPDTCYHLIHYRSAAVDIPVASDNPAHYADAIRYNVRTHLFEVTPDRSFRATNLSRNIDNVRALLAHLLYHVKVLSAQHVDVLSGMRTLRKQHVEWSRQSKW